MYQVSSIRFVLWCIHGCAPTRAAGRWRGKPPRGHLAADQKCRRRPRSRWTNPSRAPRPAGGGRAAGGRERARSLYTCTTIRTALRDELAPRLALRKSAGSIVLLPTYTCCAPTSRCVCLPSVWGAHWRTVTSRSSAASARAPLLPAQPAPSASASTSTSCGWLAAARSMCFLVFRIAFWVAVAGVLHWRKWYWTL